MRDREKAMEWWNNMSSMHRALLSRHFYRRKWEFLTGREIQKIWEELK